MFVDRIYRLPRLWSNSELRKYSHLFSGKVVNVSAWQDQDKEGNFYKDYFKNATSYSLTNFVSDARGFQGYENEIFLDLEKELPPSLYHQFDVVFNHTTLEHVFQINTAFSNLCKMSKDVLIIVVPFLQPYHSDYGDYWRFSPLAIKRILHDNNFEIVYQSFNNDKKSSVYIFTIASRNISKWKSIFKFDYTMFATHENLKLIGINALSNFYFKIENQIKKIKKFFI